MKVELGDRVKDKISGVQGIVIGVTDWLYGCRRVTVQPEEAKEGKPVECFTLDEPQVEVEQKAVIASPVVVTPEAPRTHGERQDAQRKTDAKR